MNYYHRHLGDYAKNTSHLTMLEHGAYTLLMDRYYVTEAPIPAKDVYRICGARSQEERAAVDAVLSEFFVRRGKVWRKGRCDEEIAKAQERINAARLNGLKGGRPRNPEVTQRVTKANPEQTQRKALQSPISNHQSLKKGLESPSPEESERRAAFDLGVSQLKRRLSIRQ